MKEFIKKILDHCGYEGEPNESNLELCFLDYATSGCFQNLDFDEAKDLIEDGELSIKTMCYNLLKAR